MVPTERRITSLSTPALSRTIALQVQAQSITRRRLSPEIAFDMAVVLHGFNNTANFFRIYTFFLDCLQ